MNDFWELTASPPGISGLVRWSDGAGAPPGALHPEAVHIELSGPGGLFLFKYYKGVDRAEPFPAGELKLSLETFDADYFEWQGLSFVSERMRDAMALDPSTARFFEIDSSQSAPLPRSKGYQVMEVAVTEDVLDPEHRNHEIYLPGPDGQMLPTPAWDVAFRLDAAPKHDLFYGRLSDALLLCTDAFAVRVLKAGCTGACFTDPTRRTWQSFYRTLRGIEEYVEWDEVNETEIMRVVQAIH